MISTFRSRLIEPAAFVYIFISVSIRIIMTVATSPLVSYLYIRLRQLGIDSVFGVPGDYNLISLDYLEPAGLKWIGDANELNAGECSFGELFCTYTNNHPRLRSRRVCSHQRRRSNYDDLWSRRALCYQRDCWILCRICASRTYCRISFHSLAAKWHGPAPFLGRW